MDVKPVYLVMITEANNNKYYNCVPNGDGTFTVKYGRVGGHESTATYPMSKWQSQINSKLKKGYVDNSALMQDVIEDSKIEEKTSEGLDEFSVIKNNSVRSIIKRLFDYANKVVQSSYKVSSSVVTQAMVDKAQEYIDDLSKSYASLSVEDFNSILIKIFTTIPRKMRTVKEFQSTSKDEFAKIIEREQETLDAMRGQVYKRVEKTTATNKEEVVETISILDKMGITMEDATDEDVAKIKKAMGDASHKFYKAWRVTNHETEEKYRKFVAENNIGNIKLTCHGSRNQNWFNILKTGLKIRPSGVILTGSLLGNGLYFSNPDKWHGVAKSIGYTSLGGYWTREYQNSGFIAFFETALGTSYEIHSHDNKYHSFNLEKLKAIAPNAWSLFLHGAGHSSTTTVINDEIVVYNESQTTVRYLVEIRG
jgi:poly [ADP-ribose] polymerase